MNGYVCNTCTCVGLYNTTQTLALHDVQKCIVSVCAASLLAVGSPKEGTRGLPDRRQSVALGEGIARSLTSPLSGPPPPSTPTLRQQLSFQPGSGEGSSLLNIMSSSAMSTGSNSSLRNITVKKVRLLKEKKTYFGS